MSRLSASLEERRKKEEDGAIPTLQLQGVPAKPAGWRLVEVQNGRNSVRRKFVQNSWMVFWRFVKIHCLLPCPPAETISDTHCLILVPVVPFLFTELPVIQFCSLNIKFAQGWKSSTA